MEILDGIDLDTWRLDVRSGVVEGTDWAVVSDPRAQQDRGQIGVVIIDDHEVVAQGIGALHDDVDDLSVVGLAGSVAVGLSLLERRRPGATPWPNSTHTPSSTSWRRRCEPASPVSTEGRRECVQPCDDERGDQ
jgi:hypothetical protein